MKEMSQFFGKQCRERGLIHSVRDTFYNEVRTQERKSFAECQMQKHDKLSFKEEIKTYVRLAMNSTETRTLEDVVEMLKKIYLMDIRLKGNTISYALPYHAGKTGKAQAVRAYVGYNSIGQAHMADADLTQYPVMTIIESREEDA